MRKSIIVVIALVTFSSVLSADFYTGNELLIELEKDYSDATFEEALAMAMAWGYIAGFFDAFDGVTFESPEGVIKGQIKDIAKNYLEKHSEKRHRAACVSLIDAFKEAFPKEKE